MKRIKVEVGSEIKLGSYEQSYNFKECTIVTKAITWIVLNVDDNKALLISKYALESKRYKSKDVSVTWETSAVRNWLNKTFLNTAFNADEQERILSATVIADANPKYDTPPGKDTVDKVFLLSIVEAEKYFDSWNARACRATSCCIGRGIIEDNRYCWWWLRSPGKNTDLAAFVADNGKIDENGFPVNSSGIGIRPAMWIKLGT